ncbi:alkaline phosphatase family protein [Streptomyces sp. NPDC059161]|uniref:alkaline phosphatase family protein n=1 Tax=Streptomyces sp. NPDC059161 TaxID=3346749 RepID=UPI00369B6016
MNGGTTPSGPRVVGPAIDHVVVLALENRSFDHMLGFLSHPEPDFDGLTTGGPHTNPGWDSGTRVTAEPHAKPVLPIDPDHSHNAVMEQLALRNDGERMRPTNQGFVTSLERKGRGLAQPAFGGLVGPFLDWWNHRCGPAHPSLRGMGPLALLCQPPSQVPVLSRLALEFAVCTRWFCSLPGETWPNRNFLHAATSDGEVDIVLRPYTNRTVFELLEEEGTTGHRKTWHIYHDDTPQVWAFPHLWDTADRHANWFRLTDFARHVATGKLPAYSFIEPNHRPPLHTLDHDPLIGTPDVSNSQHPGNNLVSPDAYDSIVTGPDADFARGEALIAGVYEALRSSPEVFARTVLLITYDEHGGLYDHVPPPVGVPSPSGGSPPSWTTRLQHSLWYRKADAFDFTMLGPRVPAVIVSPFIAAGTIDTQVHDHASVPATLRALFAPHAKPLTARDDWAVPFHRVLTLAAPRTDLPDLSAYADAAFVPGAAAQGAAAAEFPSTTGEIPPYYADFMKQADFVGHHLIALGEPEGSWPSATAPLHRAVQITEAFTAAARRHREGGTDD